MDKKRRLSFDLIGFQDVEKIQNQGRKKAAEIEEEDEACSRQWLSN
jgi:hypothetical protein